MVIKVTLGTLLSLGMTPTLDHIILPQIILQQVAVIKETSLTLQAFLAHMIGIMDLLNFRLTRTIREEMDILERQVSSLN